MPTLKMSLDPWNAQGVAPPRPSPPRAWGSRYTLYLRTRSLHRLRRELRHL